MRHRIFGRKLGRSKDERKALFRALVTSLILKEAIKTTEAKAKAIRGLVDKIINKGKTGNLHARRVLAQFFTNSAAIEKVIKVLGPRFRQRQSGFTRIYRIGRRRGDNAPLVKMELIEGEKEKRKTKKEKQDGRKDREKVASS